MKHQNDSDIGMQKQDKRKGTVIYMGNIEFPDKCAAAHRVINNGKILRALGYRVVFLGVAKEERFDGVRVSSYDDHIYEEAYPESGRQWIKHLFSVDHLLSLAERYSDLKLVVVYNLPYVTYLSVKNAFKNTEIKVAYDCTEWSSYTEGSVFKRIYKKIDGFAVIHFLGKRSDNIIAVSSMMAKRYACANVLLLPPLVDTSDPIWRQECDRRADVFEFCFSAATLENKDSPERVIRAFGMIKDPDVRLRVIGMDRDTAMSCYPDTCDVIRSDDRISFCGYLPHSETVRNLLSSDCFVFFRNNIRRNLAGFPTKFVEAYTCSMRILTNSVGDVDRYAASGERVFLTEEISEEAICAQMKRICSAGKKTTKNTDGTFDYHRYIDRTKEWISKLF